MRRIPFLLLAALVLAAPAAAQIDRQPKVQVSLISDRDTVLPGGTLTVAVEQIIRPGWHTYWVNPGEAGQATEIHWTLPPGWKAGATQWPYPQREQVGPIMDYGYEGKVWLLAELQVPAGAPPGEADIAAVVQYLACREVCVPEDATVTLKLFVDSAAPPPDAVSAAEFAAARAKIPAPSPWPVHYALNGGLRLYVKADALTEARPAAAQFFPLQQNVIIDAAPQPFEIADGGLVMRLTPQPGLKKIVTLDGVLVLTSTDKSVQALEVHAGLGVVPAVNFTEVPQLGLKLALLFAFLGGIILNIMPCVLPVLAMKALALAGHAGADRRHARVESFVYSAGAVLSFIAFGLLVALLRSGGVAVGWGFQLQEPLVVALLAILMAAVGLNLSGLYEFAPITAGEGLTRRGGLMGAFFTGVLAVAVAAPCTAPFMAAAIGYGFTQSPLVVLAVFTALGLGFALPFLLLGVWPAMHRILPKPGPWMVRLRHILAIPMYGAAVWLFWVLAQQVDRTGLLAALAALAAVGVALWAWGVMQLKSGLVWAGGMTGVLLSLAAAAYALSFVAGAAKPPAAPAVAHAGMKSEPYSASHLAQLRQENRAVFVDATASWCITCLVNEEAALSRPAVRDAFAARHIVFLVADWTNGDPAITKLLEAHGRSGVPLYLYYAPGAAEPKILPQLLTEGEVLRTIGAP